MGTRHVDVPVFLPLCLRLGAGHARACRRAVPCHRDRAGNTDADKVPDHSRSYIGGNTEGAPFLNNEMWDEGSRSDRMPLFAAGAGVRKGHQSDVNYTHRSVLKTVERIFGLPVLPAVSDATDLSDMFEPGVLP